MQDVEGVAPGGFQPLLAPAADLIEADRREWSDQGETRRQREQHGQDIEADGKPAEIETGDRIDEAQEQEMAGHGPEIIQPLGQGILQVRRANPVDGQRSSGFRHGGRTAIGPAVNALRRCCACFCHVASPEIVSADLEAVPAMSCTAAIAFLMPVESFAPERGMAICTPADGPCRPRRRTRSRDQAERV